MSPVALDREGEAQRRKTHCGHWSSHEVRVADEGAEAAGDRNGDAYRSDYPGDPMEPSCRFVSGDPERGSHQEGRGSITERGDCSPRVTPRKVFGRIEALRGCPPKAQREGDHDDQRRGPGEESCPFADRHVSEPGDHLNKSYHRCESGRSTEPLARLHCIPAVTDAP